MSTVTTEFLVIKIAVFSFLILLASAEVSMVKRWSYPFIGRTEFKESIENGSLTLVETTPFLTLTTNPYGYNELALVEKLETKAGTLGKTKTAREEANTMLVIKLIT